MCVRLAVCLAGYHSYTGRMTPSTTNPSLTQAAPLAALQRPRVDLTQRGIPVCEPVGSTPARGHASIVTCDCRAGTRCSTSPTHRRYEGLDVSRPSLVKIVSKGIK
jgi:hypothetical protein